MTAGARARATSRRPTGRSGPCSTCRSTVDPGEAVALRRLERRRQDHGRPGRLGAGGARAAGTVLVDGDDLTGAAPTSSPAPGWPTPPRAGRCSPPSPSRRTSTLSFRRALGRARGRRRRSTRAYELFPAPRPSAASRSPARCRAASSACCRWPAVMVEAAEAADRRRAVARPRADHRRRALREPRAAPRRGHRAPHRRAAGRPRARAVRPGGHARPRARRRWTGDVADAGTSSSRPSAPAG